MKALFASMVLLSLYSGTLAAGAPDRDLALKYLETSKIEDVINASISEYETQFVKKDATPEQRAKVHKFFESAMGWDKTKDQLADLVMKLYTQEELEASIAFMSTPAGASFTAKNGEFSKQWSAVLAINLKKVAGQKAVASK